MCNLYAVTKGQQAIRDLTRAMADRTGNLPPLPGIYPDYPAPSSVTRQTAANSPWRAGACRHRRQSSGARTPTRASPTSAMSPRRTGAGGWVRRAVAWCRSPASRTTRPHAGRQAAANLACPGREPPSCLLRRYLDAVDLGPKGAGGRDHERRVRLPDHRTQRPGRQVPSQGDAGHPQDGRGNRHMDVGSRFEAFGKMRHIASGSLNAAFRSL